MPYRHLRDHGKIIDYVTDALEKSGWKVEKEYRVDLSHRRRVRLDILAIDRNTSIALAIEAKIDSSNKAISGGIGQLLFYRRVLPTKDFNDIFFALVVPGGMIEYEATTEGYKKLPEPRYYLPISGEARGFAQDHSIKIFIAMENGIVKLATYAPLSLRLLLADLEMER